MVVGEHPYTVEARPVRAGGGIGRENVGMSNRKARENRAPRKSKVSSATKIDGGLGGPKAMAKAAADGQLVNIPARRIRVTDEVTRKINLSALMVWRCWLKNSHCGKSR